MATDLIHPTQTRRSQYHYLFTSKHHGGGSAGDAQWAPDVTQSEEFSVFDDADFHEIFDDRSWLYGGLRSPTGELRDLGTWQQQIAEFPKTAAAWWDLPPTNSGRKAQNK
jgi:hypothetical protein